MLTGLTQALGTKWGLFRHYWVLVKLVLNLLAVAILLMYMLLLVAAVLSVYKPRGMTGYGWRKRQEQRTGITATVQ